MASGGLEYRRSFQVLRSIRVGPSPDGGLHATGEAFVSSEPGERGWLLHPSLIDGGMQLGAAAGATSSSSGGGSKVPAAVESPPKDPEEWETKLEEAAKDDPLSVS